MKIYVLTAGDYSDYRIVAVSESEKKAELLRVKLEPFVHDIIDIEEYETNKYDDGIKKRPAYAIFFDKSGAAVGVNQMDIWEAMDMIGSSHLDACSVDAKRKVIRVIQIADNKEQAIKAAAEKRARFMDKHMEYLEEMGYFAEEKPEASDEN